MWGVPIDVFSAGEAERRLTRAERDRCRRHVRPDDRLRCWIGRAVLRDLLSGYADTPVADITIEAGPWGKPYVPGSSLRFSVSHSGRQILIGVTRGVELGVDVELIRPFADSEGICHRYFGPHERRHVAAAAADGGGSRRAFFECWVRKEAYLKMLGYGLSDDLQRIDTLWVARDLLVPYFADLPLDPLAFHADVLASEYAVALVARTSVLPVDCWQYVSGARPSDVTGE